MTVFELHVILQYDRDRTNDRRYYMNRYLEIFHDIENKILEGTYAPNTLLPSENQLSSLYQVSRETIRKALTLLLENGYIQKKQGKGSIVLDINRLDFPISALTSYKELQQAKHLKSETFVHQLTKKTIRDTSISSKEFQPNDQVWELIRQRKIDGEFVLLDKDYLLTSIIPELPKEKAETSIYEYFEDKLQLEIGYAQKEIIAEQATPEDQELMDLGPTDTHVIVVRSHVYLADTTLFQYTESRHRLDKFRFIEFARRRRSTK